MAAKRLTYGRLTMSQPNYYRSPARFWRAPASAGQSSCALATKSAIPLSCWNPLKLEDSHYVHAVVLLTHVMRNPWFNVRKAAQIAAFFAREQGGAINVLKLTKLVYIADRFNMQRYDFPISGDNFVSMDHGPVNSITYNYINGMEDQRNCWAEFLQDRNGYRVGLVRDALSDDDLDELSRAELQTLKDVWAEFGRMDQFQLRDWTHQNCPEWEDPHGSSAAIPFERVLGNLDKPNARDIAEDILAQRRVTEAFAVCEDRALA